MYKLLKASSTSSSESVDTAIEVTENKKITETKIESVTETTEVTKTVTEVTKEKTTVITSKFAVELTFLQ